MPQIYKLWKATRLRLLFQTEDSIGVAREKGLEVVPNTPTARRRFGVKTTYTNTDSITIVDNRLRAYQLEDAIFLANKKAAACFNEQRTGKTPTSLISLDAKGCKKILIICPSSMVIPWANHFTEWLGRPCIPLNGTAPKRKKLITEWTDGLVIGYESLRIVDHYDKETKEYTHSTGDLGDILKHKDIDAVLVDEIHRIRNYKTKTAEAIFKLSKVPNRLALTGTPALKEQPEIYSTLKFLYPTLFKSYWRFVDYYFHKELKEIWNGRKRIATTEIGSLRRAQELQEFLDIISTQRKRIEVMPWLPVIDKETIKLKPTAEQARYIAELREFYETEHIITQGTLDTLIRERQICNHPALLDLAGSSPKLEWLKQYLKDYPEKSIIIFSKFTAWLELLGKELNTDALITGKVSKVRREDLKNKFQSGMIKILLVNIDAGKEGLTLDHADTIVFTDKFAPVGDINQAEDRFIATTQERVKHGQVIYTLLLDETYEVNIDASLKRSADELELINDYKKHLKGVQDERNKS